MNIFRIPSKWTVHCARSFTQSEAEKRQDEDQFVSCVSNEQQLNHQCMIYLFHRLLSELCISIFHAKNMRDNLLSVYRRKKKVLFPKQQRKIYIKSLMPHKVAKLSHILLSLFHFFFIIIFYLLLNALKKAWELHTTIKVEK